MFLFFCVFCFFLLRRKQDERSSRDLSSTIYRVVSSWVYIVCMGIFNCIIVTSKKTEERQKSGEFYLSDHLTLILSLLLLLY